MKKFLLGSLIFVGVTATGACLLAKKMELFRDDSVDYEKFESRQSLVISKLNLGGFSYD